jgi:SAM-dependent methyltransferase
MTDSYAFAGADHDAERIRLQSLEAWTDPLTIRQLEAVGTTAGWRCADVGAGAGSIARWLAARVGPSGSVVAADLDPRFLTELPDSVEVRRHDISTEDLEANAYDLVHCRAVLIHLARPEVALARMVAALKPGGWLVVEDGDWGLCTIAGHPDGPWATEYLHHVWGLHAQAGIRFPYFGRTLPGLVAELGLGSVDGEVCAPVSPDGHPTLEMHRMTVSHLRQASLAAGASEGDFDRLVGVLGSPSVVLLGVAIVGVRGRKPGPFQRS